MTVHQEDEQAALRSKLLTPQEQAICKQIATGKAPHSQRAFALLTLNENSTQVHAADQAGLSPGQVGYWLARFRKLGLGIFPDTLLEELDAEAKVEPVTEIKGEPEPVTEKADSAEEGKDVKGEKEKTAKEKTMKDKKDKKGKKAKKTAKRTREDKKEKKGKKKTKKAKKGQKGKKTKKT